MKRPLRTFRPPTPRAASWWPGATPLSSVIIHPVHNTSGSSKSLAGAREMASWVKRLQWEHDTRNPQKDGKEGQTAQRCSLPSARVPSHTNTQTHCNNNVLKLIPIRFLVNGLPYFLCKMINSPYPIIQVSCLAPYTSQASSFTG